MRRLPPLNWLRAFEAAARHLSFTQAADELRITQSAVSQQIRLLEAHLGEPLFYRRGRGISLTEAANRLYPVIHDSFDRIERSSSAFSHPDSDEVVSISSNISFLKCWLLPRLPEFLRLYPRVGIRLSTTRWSTDPRQTGASLEIIYGDGSWALPTEQLTHARRFPVCSPALADKMRTAADLLRFPLISNIGEEYLWAEWARKAGVEFAGEDQRFAVDLQLLAMDLAARGEGIAMANWILAADRIKSGELCVPIKVSIAAKDNYYLAYAASRRKGALPAGDLVKWMRRRLLAEEKEFAARLRRGRHPDRH
jgi:LysR family glycine cleavage system transcriptional activator